MIWESSFWKDDLLRRAKTLRKRKVQRRWPEASLARVEQDVMIAFYSIRKLIEASKVATAIVGLPVEIQRFPWSGKNVTKINWHKLDKLYDLGSPSVKREKLARVCNQIVHSYVFSLAFAETGGLHGLLFTSDRERHHFLHSLDVDQVIDLLEHVGTDYPNEVYMALNPKTGDYDVTAVTHRSGSPANKPLQTVRPSAGR